jgi:hypothetical protein
MIRRTPVKKRRSKPRRGRVVDEDFLAWMATQGCLVHLVCPEGSQITIHHVREFGSPKNDRRTLTLCTHAHMEAFSKRESIEALGKKAWELLHGVSIEGAIGLYNRRYESERAA